jgi:transposase-like protein
MTRHSRKKASRSSIRRNSGRKLWPRRRKSAYRNTAKELRFHSSQFYGWRSKAREKQDQRDLEQSLVAENTRLKHNLAQHPEELAIVKKSPFLEYLTPLRCVEVQHAA